MYVGQGNWVKALVINVNILILSRLHGLSLRINALRKYLLLVKRVLCVCVCGLYTYVCVYVCVCI